MAVITVKTLDNATSSLAKPFDYVIEFIGRFRELTENYLILESIKNVDNGEILIDEGKTEAYHHILRKVITESPKILREEEDTLEELNSLASKISAKIICNGMN